MCVLGMNDIEDVFVTVWCQNIWNKHTSGKLCTHHTTNCLKQLHSSCIPHWHFPKLLLLIVSLADTPGCV